MIFHVSATAVLLGGLVQSFAFATDLPNPPSPEPIEVVELPLPPVSSSTSAGACTDSLNPRRTGCISQSVGEFQAGDFTPDGNHVVVNVEFVGAPAAPDPASIYTGEQLILVKADGTTFSNGDSWKCLSCGVPTENAQSLDPQRDYPHAFRSGDKALWGHNILDCGGESLASDACTPNRTHIYPIHWTVSADGSGTGGSPRELRLHPDDVHMGFSSFTSIGGQLTYFARLEFDPNPTAGIPLVPRYEFKDISILHDPNGKGRISSNGSELFIHNDAITVGELRGFSGTGNEITYLGSTVEANNLDVFAIHTVTGKTRRLTSHPEYTDPMAFAADDQWFIVMDTRGTDRQMWMSGMRAIPPLIDIVAVASASSTRNNGPRRFFQPILIDGFGDRGSYYGQRVNAAGDGSSGSVNDPNWNGRADPAFSLDGTKIVFWQALVVSPSCGGLNPLVCPISTAQGGREYRLMLARLTSRQPKAPPPVFEVPDIIPWAVPFIPGATLPTRTELLPGNYVLNGKASGFANVELLPDANGITIKTVTVNYTNYSDDSEHFLSGFESVTRTVLLPNVWNNRLDWYSDLNQTGVVTATKKTSPDGFHLTIDAQINIFNATGELTTTIDGVVYKQPANGT
jgi:hypothetical protein